MTPEASSRLIVVVGPSGAGKDTVLRLWREQLPADAPVHFVRRLVTRGADPGGENHEPVSEPEFARLLAEGALAFHWEAHGLHYGIHRDALTPLARGEWVVLNGSRQYLPAMRRIAPRLRVLELTAPPEVLARRLRERAREQGAALDERLARAALPVQADLTLVNDGDACAGAQALHRWWLSLRTAS
jgi:phosphonate metabolism protein PhnN/1,5-bisphosphokinase (PRPP-forming)